VVALKSIRKETYAFIDIIKFLFAILIVTLHIDFGESSIFTFVRQYIARLGVLFFVALSFF